jgi:hypothetical protein
LDSPIFSSFSLPGTAGVPIEDESPSFRKATACVAGSA